MTKISMDLVKTLRDKTQVGMLDCKRALEESNGDLEKAVDLLRKKGAAVAAKRADNATNNRRIESFVNPDFQRASLIEISCETDFSANTDSMKQFAHQVASQVAATGMTEVDGILKLGLSDRAGLTIKDALDELIAKIAESIKVNKATQAVIDGNGVVNTYIHPGSTVGTMVVLQTDKTPGAQREQLAALARELCMQVAVTNPVCIDPAGLDPAIKERERSLAREQLKDSKKPENIVEKIIEGKLNSFYAEVCLLNQPFIKQDKLSVQQHVDEISKATGLKINVVRFTRFAIGR